MSSRAILSKRLKALQKLKGMTQNEFAEELAIGRSTLCAIYGQKENTTIDSLDQIADRLGRTASALLSVAGDPDSGPSLIIIQDAHLQNLSAETREAFITAISMVQKELNGK